MEYKMDFSLLLRTSTNLCLQSGQKKRNRKLLSVMISSMGEIGYSIWLLLPAKWFSEHPFTNITRSHFLAKLQQILIVSLISHCSMCIVKTGNSLLLIKVATCSNKILVNQEKLKLLVASGSCDLSFIFVNLRFGFESI